MIRVILAEDQKMMLSAIATLLDLEQDIEVVATAAGGNEALTATESLKPDVLVTDIEMPGMNGIELCERVRLVQQSCQVLILTSFERCGYFARALDAGACGYLLKDTTPGELADAIRHIHRGGKWLDAALSQEAAETSDPLTSRLRQVLRLIEQGMGNRCIARELELSQGTVRNYVHEAISRLGVANRLEASRTARENGWL